jgi:iron complex transport system substrate-binding protein
MFKNFKLKFFCFFAAIVFSAAAAATANAKTFERIVSLAPSVTEVLFAIGAGERVVAVTNYCVFPEKAKSLPKVGAFTDHNMEAILLEKPDLVVLTHNRGSKFTYEKLKDAGIETLAVSFYSLPDLIDSFRMIGEKTGNLPQAEKWKSDFEAIVKDVRARHKNQPKRKVAFVTWHFPLIVPGRGTYENDILELAGTRNIAADSDVRYPQLGIEAFLSRDPEMIIDASRHSTKMSFATYCEEVKKFWAQYPHLRAVKSGEVYVFKEDIYSVPGPRTIQLIRAIDQIMGREALKAGDLYERIQFEK